MKVNSRKWELIRNVTDHMILDYSSGEEILAQDTRKYLGQFIEQDGVPRSEITKKDLGKIIDLLENNSGLTRSARIKLFKIYAQNRVGHLILLFCFTKNTRKTWKTIRSVIFK
jgi:hypothetical protein